MVMQLLKQFWAYDEITKRDTQGEREREKGGSAMQVGCISRVFGHTYDTCLTPPNPHLPPPPPTPDALL